MLSPAGAMRAKRPNRSIRTTCACSTLKNSPPKQDQGDHDNRRRSRSAPQSGSMSSLPVRRTVPGRDRDQHAGGAFQSGGRQTPINSDRARISSAVSSGTISSVASCVAARRMRGALPASNASFQRAAHRHQQSPGFSPAKPVLRHRRRQIVAGGLARRRGNRRRPACTPYARRNPRGRCCSCRRGRTRSAASSSIRASGSPIHVARGRAGRVAARVGAGSIGHGVLSPCRVRPAGARPRAA